MTDINIHHTSISTLLEPRVKGPYTENGQMRHELWEAPFEEVESLKESSRLSIPVYGKPYLVGYLFDRVARGLTTLEPETLNNVKRPEGTAVKNYIEAFGGRIATIGSRRGIDDLMQIGKYVVEWDWGTQAFGDDYGPDAGPMTVHPFDTPEAAIQKVELVTETYSALLKARKVFEAARVFNTIY